MIPDVIVAVRERTDVATARRFALKLAAFDENDAGALGIVVTEAATNLIKHAGGGDLIVRMSSSRAESPVEVLAIDRGPGIANLTRSFEDGYSTAGGAGTGLGAIMRASSFFDIYSAPEKGTVLMARVGRSMARSADSIEAGGVCAAFPGEEISGDAWALETREERFRIVVADGLGHGPLAAEASNAGIEAVANRSFGAPAEALESAHLRLRATRGAAMSIADADPLAGAVSFAGIGNVTGIVMQDAKTRRPMVCVNGTLGHQVRATRQYQYPLPPDSLLILHSDGLSAGWSFDNYPGLFQRHPGIIAAVMFRDFRRTRDDATIVVARARKAAT